MASTSNIQTTPSSSDPSSCSERRWKYQVFLSFRGETRYTFTSHLYNALQKKFIIPFKDDEKLEIGTPIKKELLEAIEKSRMAVIIISKEYASSTWCLEELAKIVECKKDREMKVLPIFYHVEPRDVRNQEGTFRDAFALHEQNLVNEDKVRTWKNALKEVSYLVGRSLKINEDESTFIEIIVKWISKNLIIKLIDEYPEYNLVGIDSHDKEMNKHLDFASNDVRFIGICGMSGMGKTTLARVIFQKYNHLFQARSFLEGVSSRGLVALEEKLLSELKDDQEEWDVPQGIAVIRNRLRGTKVLIVLDDVDKIGQLEKLAGNSNWFGPGSRIIVTTEDTHLLTRHGVQIIYPIKGLHKKEALQLFCQKAFRNHQCPDQDFLDLCNGFVSYADGHPLTLDRLGSSMLGKGKHVWKSLLDRLQVLPNRDIQKKLKIGFKALGETEKKMFLDIACFFNGEDKHRVVDLLEDSDCFPEIDIETLVDKSLVTILGEKLWMHSLLQIMGREIVRCEDRDEPGKRSRLWRREDIFKVLQENSGTCQVQGIMLSPWSPHQEEDLKLEAFSNMKKLRLLKICDVNLPRGLNSLSNWLLLMEWHKYSSGSIPESFQPSNLVELIMHHSNLLQLPTFLNLNRLKVMDFSSSENLMMTPDFSGCPSLQRLIFEGCTGLYEVHPSIAALNQLILLNLKDCKSLSRLPHEINLESLNILILSGCSSFSKFPEIGQNMKLLSELYLDGTAIEELPLSIQHLIGLTLLNLGECKKLSVFPSVICCLPALKTLILSGSTPTLPLLNFFSWLTFLVALDVSDCNLLDGALPEDLSSLSSLESLKLKLSISQLPKVEKFKKLRVMDLSGSKYLRMTPDFSGWPSLQKLIFEGCTRLCEVHPSIGALKHLILLNLKDCKCLRNLPPEINLESLNLLILSGCSSLNKFPEIGQNLSELYLDRTAIEELPLSIQHLIGLTFLNLGECKKLSVCPSVICCLPALKTLILSGSTHTLSLLKFFSALTSLVTLDLSDCNLLDGALPEDLSSLSSLESLDLSRNNFTRLPESISQLPKLKVLSLVNCSNLQLLPKLPPNIQFVNTRECPSLQNYSNQVVVSTSAGGSISDDIKMREASGVGSARKRKMEEAFGQREIAKVVRFDKHGRSNAT